MQISNFILGVLAFIATAVACLTFMYDMYTPAHYNVDLASNNYTAPLGAFYAKVNQTMDTAKTSGDNIYYKITGEKDASIGSSGSQGDAWTNSLLSVTQISDYFQMSLDLITSTFKALGFSESGGVIIWWIVTSMILSIALTLIGIVFYRAL